MFLLKNAAKKGARQGRVVYCTTKIVLNKCNSGTKEKMMWIKTRIRIFFYYKNEKENGVQETHRLWIAVCLWGGSEYY